MTCTGRKSKEYNKQIYSKEYARHSMFNTPKVKLCRPQTRLFHLKFN